MTNCKSCLHQKVCKKKIKDYNTYRICSDYQGTCSNCIHNRSIFLIKRFCYETSEWVDDINFCGLWEGVNNGILSDMDTINT